MRWVATAWIFGALALSGCSKESRLTDADQPVTAPSGSADPRAAQYRDNAFQVSQGSRYFSWYGCGGCHAAGAAGALNIAKGRWRRGGTIDRIFASITGHGQLGQRIPIEQRWQLAAYVMQLPGLDPALRRRQDLDSVGEAQASQWRGPIR